MQYLCSILNFRQYSCSVTQLFMLYCGPPQTMAKVGGGMGQGPATEVIQLDLNYSNAASLWGEPEQVGHNMYNAYGSGVGEHMC